MNPKKELDPNRLPVHIAIIMDGNGRWAKEHNKNRLFGHRQGVKSVKEVVKAATEFGIKYLTLYTFSTENWNRPQNEVGGLMRLLISTTRSELQEIHENNVKISVIGEFQRVPSATRKEIERAVEKTSLNTGLNLIIALSYSSRWDILNAVKSISIKVKTGEFGAEDISDDLIKNNLSTCNIPDPDLLIRTSGEYRISNFLLWELAYSELYFTQKKWPEFGRNDLFDAIIDYQNRERRFGKVSEQIK